MARLSWTGCLAGTWLMLLLAAWPCGAQTPPMQAQRPLSPVEIVRQLYQPYVADGDAADFDSLQAIADHADGALKALVARDRACEAKEQGICRIDFDPVINGQDWNLNGKAPVFTEADTASGKTISAAFASYGIKIIIRYDFVLQGDQWLISDVRDTEHGAGGPWDLVEILSAKM